ncbi:hypothetical protein SMC26_23160 [Actinomadura fulvescens]|uniref:Uncharacterized protein n=1 Tax=Actinomadura fulvescens TaxID=46160 RepID=A0ABN3QXE2_9ACTN
MMRTLSRLLALATLVGATVAAATIPAHAHAAAAGPAQPAPPGGELCTLISNIAFDLCSSFAPPSEPSGNS